MISWALTSNRKTDFQKGLKSGSLLCYKRRQLHVKKSICKTINIADGTNFSGVETNVSSGVVQLVINWYLGIIYRSCLANIEFLHLRSKLVCMNSWVMEVENCFRRISLES